MSTPTSETNGNVTATRPSKGGLEGVVAAITALSKIEGTEGRLIYRGYNIHDLARSTSFEEVAYLLWFASCPIRHNSQICERNWRSNARYPPQYCACCMTCRLNPNQWTCYVQSPQPGRRHDYWQAHS